MRLHDISPAAAAAEPKRDPVRRRKVRSLAAAAAAISQRRCGGRREAGEGPDAAAAAVVVTPHNCVVAAMRVCVQNTARGEKAISPVSLFIFSSGIATSFRISPYEWDNPHPCKADPDELESLLDLKNALWFGIGSFLCQGSDILPK